MQFQLIENTLQGDPIIPPPQGIKKVNAKAIKYIEMHKKANEQATLSLPYQSTEQVLTYGIKSDAQLSKPQNNSFNSSNIFSVEDKNYLKEVEGDMIAIDQQSYISSTREVSQQKNSLTREILTDKPPKFARYFIKIGQSCSFISIITPIIFFWMLMNFTVNQNFNFQNFMIVYHIINNSNQVIHQVEKVRFFEKGITSTHLNEPVSEMFKGYQQQTLSIISEYKKSISQLTLLKSNENGADFINKTSLPFINSDGIKTSISFIVWMQSMLVYGYQYINEPDNNKFYTPIFSNFIEYQDLLLEAFENSVKDSENSLKSLQNLINFNLITSTIVTVLSILIIIPISLIVEKKKEEFVKLICTYPVEKLDDYLESTCNSLKSHYIENGHLFAKSKEDFLIIKRANIYQGKGRDFVDCIAQNQFGSSNKLFHSAFVSNQNKKKKRALSQTTSLSTQKIQAVLLSSICFGILIISPYIQYFLGNDFISVIKEQMEMSEHLSLINFQINYSYSKTFLNINMQLFKNDPIFNENDIASKYLENFKELGEQNKQIDEILSEFSNEVVSVFDLDPIQKKLISTIILDDACDVLNNRQDLIDDFVKVSYGNETEYCEGKESQSLMRRGLIISSQFLFDVSNAIYSILSKEGVNVQNEIQNYDNQYDLNTISNLSSEFDASISICHNLIKEKIKRVTNDLYAMFYTLFTFQMIALVCIYYYLWKKVMQEISKNFYSVKNLFTFFSIDQILQNSYITNFLQEEIRHNSSF